MDYSPDETWSIGFTLGSYVHHLWNGYLDYWELQNPPATSELSDQQRSQIKDLHEIASSLAQALYSLHADPEVMKRVRTFIRVAGVSEDVTDAQAVGLLRAIRNHPVIRHGVNLELALHATDDLLADAENRTAVLLGMIAHVDLSERAAAFLNRATRLYLWGFEPESIIMCAAGIGAAYESRFPSELMENLKIRANQYGYRLVDYDTAARREGIFSATDVEMVVAIRRARNDLIHNVPDTGLKPESVLWDTLHLVSLLFPPGAPAA